MRTFCLVLLIGLSNGARLSAQSIFASGNWHKIEVNKTGIYKIDHSFFKEKLKVDVKDFDPRTVRLFGGQVNGMLPQENAIQRPSNPVELAILGVGTSDGKMDQNDYFLFCGFGPNHFSVDSTVHYEKNLYTDVSGYFITYGLNTGKRIQVQSAYGPVGTPLTSYTEYITYEVDEVNKFKSGRLWLGPDLKGMLGSEENYSFSAEGALGAVTITTGVAAACIDGCNFEVFLNDNLAGKILVGPILGGEGNEYEDKARYSDTTFQTTITGQRINLDLKFNGSNQTSGHLDYMVVSYERELAVYENFTIMHTGNLDDTRTYEVKNVTGQTQVWDISDRSEIKSLTPNNHTDKLQFSLPQGESHTIALFDQASNFPVPSYIGPVPNQNIKSLISNEGIIISPDEFLVAANRLAEFHRSQDNLSVAVVTVKQVYNEFSSGVQDITAIRDFLKYLYEQGGALRYALLFGDGSYDYKNRVSEGINFIPVYESRNSFHPIYSYCSDDYFGFFGQDEGYWFEGVRKKNSLEYIIPYQDHTLEIGIGRLPVKSSQEADEVVDKITRYKTSEKALGKWRNDIAYFSDDGDNSIHMEHAETLFKLVDSSYLTYNAKKLYLDNFNQENHQSPEATQRILDVLKEGVFIFNYTGHGDKERLTSEGVITSSVIDRMTNRQKLPLFIAATCDFGKYDDPGFTSGGEMLLLNPNGGAIALICTTRPVYAHTNLPLNQAFHKSIFAKIEGEYPRLGDVIRITKNESLAGPVNRNFALVGDPMLRLNYPEHSITFDLSKGGVPDTLSALEEYTLTGQLVSSGTRLQTFNGKGIVTLWDIPQSKVTKGSSGGLPYEYEEQTNALYRGRITIDSGSFELTFILPKNSSYKYLPGKLTMYAWSEGEGLTDAAGASRDFVLGGTSSSYSSDLTPPTGKVYINEASFRPGSTVGTTSLLIAKLSDESGINISNNGFNNSITFSLNEADPIELNDYYIASEDTYKEGTLLFPLQDLAPGKYSGVLKFWDTHNNSAELTVEFNVSDKPVIRIYNAMLYPNPATIDDQIRMRFDHDREGEEVEINILLYNMNGDLVHKHEYLIDNSPGTIDELTWSPVNFQGAPLENGIYIYRLTISSTLDAANNEIIKRLVIIN